MHLTNVTLTRLCLIIEADVFKKNKKTHTKNKKNMFSSEQKHKKVSNLTHIAPQGTVEALVFALSLSHLEKIKTNENQHFISDVAGNEAPLPPSPHS